MRITTLSLKKSLKPLLKRKPLRSEMDSFKEHLTALLDKIAIIEKQPRDESEEHLKNNIRDFLRDSFYKNTHAINTKDKKDLVIHNAKGTDSDVAIIVEAKRPNNKTEMITVESANKKAMHELILYYLSERNVSENAQLKHLVITNIYEWYIFDSNLFDKLIYRNTAIQKLFQLKQADKKDNPFFYEELEKILSRSEIDLPCIHFDIRDYSRYLKSNNKDQDKELIPLFKVLSADYLLKLAVADDSNTLNEKFYTELLHLIGLEEIKSNNKLSIVRKEKDRSPYSLLERTIDALRTEDPYFRLPDTSIYGADKTEWEFTIALELCLTWINRILFLKLLEGQLIKYHNGNRSYEFLNAQAIHDFDELFTLFHKVLAVNTPDRQKHILDKYQHVPYLNSSLFDYSELEEYTIKINALENKGELPLHKTTSLTNLKKQQGALPFLKYLFSFLDAYDFSSEGAEEIQEDNKTIISASVLGKVFEKINGYKDGSIFTPAAITMYLCRQSIRTAVLNRFNDQLSEPGKRAFDHFEEIVNYTSRLNKPKEILEINDLINSIKICDPAVGSGHFLVSALNEMIAIKSELRILADDTGHVLGGIEIDIVNDELIITDTTGNIIDYRIQQGRPVNKEAQRLQKTLFTEKQTIIENCLFGVDINPKSVLICRLRLWIELLKNAYYKELDFTELETLPNIDINIKCGNSLLSRFPLDSDLKQALSVIKYDVKAYKQIVNNYKNEKSRDAKKSLQKIIDSIKYDFRTEIAKNDHKVLRLNRLNGELYTLTNQTKLFEEDAKQKKQSAAAKQKLETEIKKLSIQLDQIKTNAIFKNAFEWRFEFPEVLDNDGVFQGFDVLIGNPPYIQLQKLSDQIKVAYESQGYTTFVKGGDIYQLFYELGVNLLRTNGELGYITSNKWMRTDYGSVTRKYFSENYNTRLVVDFGMAQMFNSATTYTNIMLLSKQKPNPVLSICRIRDDYDKTVLLEDYIDFASISIDHPGENSWIAYDKKELALIKKITAQGNPLSEWDIVINRGILTGLNDAFVITTAQKDAIVAQDPKSGELIKPLLRGEDIKAFVPEWAGFWIIGTFPSLKIDIDLYPGIKAHLSQFKERLTPKPKNYDEKKGKWKGRKTGSYQWFEIQDTIGYYADFLKPKIIYPNMTKFLPFVYDKHQFFTNQKCFIITGKYLAYLNAFFNSKMFRVSFKDKFPELLGDTRELSKTYFELMSVIEPDESTALAFEPIVAAIENNIHNSEPVETLLEELETMIANIYSLTDSERALICAKTDWGLPVEEQMTAISESSN